MARLQAGMRSIETMVQRGIDPVVAAAGVARFHRNAVAEAKTQNRRILGVLDIREESWVDGRKVPPATFESVNLDGGRLTTNFPFPATEILEYIDYLLVTRSPVGPTGRYQRSHRLFADGTETDPQFPDLNAKEWVFTSNLPYARKVERGQGSAPNEGVYQGAVALANKKYGNIASIRFTFEAVVEGAVQDYAAVALGGRSGGRKASASARAARTRHVEARYPAIRIRLR